MKAYEGRQTKCYRAQQLDFLRLFWKGGRRVGNKRAELRSNKACRKTNKVWGLRFDTMIKIRSVSRAGAPTVKGKKTSGKDKKLHS